STWRGKQITLLSKDGERGLSGLYIEDNEYEGRISKQLKVTATAEIVPVGSANDFQDEPGDGGKPDRRNQQEEKKETQQAMTSGDAALLMAGMISRYDAIMRLCEDACYVAAEESKVEMTQERLQARISTLFIAASRYAETHTPAKERIDTYRDAVSQCILDFIRLQAVRERKAPAEKREAQPDDARY